MQETMQRKRIYESVLKEHLSYKREMAFLWGARQCGKTTLAKVLADKYFSWDEPGGRRLFSGGVEGLAAACGLSGAGVKRGLFAFDGVQKFGRWETLLEQFHGKYGWWTHLIVTGSARPDFRVPKEGEGRSCWRLFRMHPFGVAEVARPELVLREVHAPRPIADADWEALWAHGGFPEPFGRRDRRFTSRWRKARRERFFKEDLRDLSRVIDVGGMQMLAERLGEKVGEMVVAAPIAKELGVAETTVKAWAIALERFREGWFIRPWSRGIVNPIRKAPKWYPVDWSEVKGDAKRFGAMVACHLLKAVDLWTDLGLGTYELHYVRSKAGPEVDFLVTKNGAPWMLAEPATGGTDPSESLVAMQKATGATHAFRVVRDLPYSDADAFLYRRPVAVSARGFLSQLF